MWEIYKKEFIELIRDKKTLIFTIVMPTIVIPILIFGMMVFVHNVTQKNEKEILKYAIFNGEEIPAITTALNEHKKFKLVENIAFDDVKKAIKEKKIKFAIVLPEKGREGMDKGRQITIKLYYNNAAFANKVHKRVSELVKEISTPHKEMLFERYGIDSDLFAGLDEPIKLEKKSTADKREELGNRIGGLLPYLIILMCLTGAMYPALDLGVGEKERGTLETLLISPVPRSSIVMAKFLVIFTTSFLAVFLEVLSLLTMSILAGNVAAFVKVQEVLSVISMLDVSLVILMLIPVASIFASVLLAISIYARNFKEAQNYMSPMIMLTIVPIIVAILPGIELDWIMASIPLANVSLAIKEIVKGTIDYTMLGVIFASTVTVAGILLYMCTHWFNRETVLFRS
ncbi:ABC transporter permease [Pleionea sp. CnH1-48]|uniref:ABC transporter permease n=1 Tax=Pleionea sp. CnH1-48 TaxID=2954494 RepID=UPI002097B234|nr:ABC transporter permease [Pleionea sp. CnH1-48]MCO7225428.1 ABC transporter permease [Pleionea sp. CnH1-48]